jgi:hypothetical protein
MRFDSLPLDVLLRGKQLEKLEFALEAIQLTADIPPLSTRLTVPKLKRICGKFWHNPDLTADTIRTVASTINAPHALNFAIKLEPWIMRHRTRSQESSISPDGILTFEYGDWIVDAGNLRIRRVSKWLAPLWTKIARYFAHESQGPLTPIHTRLGHERRWYIEYTTDGGRQVMNCMVNYKSKMIWNQMTKKVYDFEGRLYDFGPPDDDEEPEDVWDEIEEEQE